MEAEKVYSKDVLVLESSVSIRETQPEHTTVDGSPATWHRRCWAHQVKRPSLCVQHLFATDFKTGNKKYSAMSRVTLMKSC